jgi:hypothetical protein
MDAGTGPGWLHRCLPGLFGSVLTVSLIGLVVVLADLASFERPGWAPSPK